jgi:hypothetical protein
MLMPRKKEVAIAYKTMYVFVEDKPNKIFAVVVRKTLGHVHQITTPITKTVG